MNQRQLDYAIARVAELEAERDTLVAQRDKLAEALRMIIVTLRKCELGLDTLGI